MASGAVGAALVALMPSAVLMAKEKDKERKRGRQMRTCYIYLPDPSYGQVICLKPAHRTNAKQLHDKIPASQILESCPTTRVTCAMCTATPWFLGTAQMLGPEKFFWDRLVPPKRSVHKASKSGNRASTGWCRPDSLNPSPDAGERTTTTIELLFSKMEQSTLTVSLFTSAVLTSVSKYLRALYISDLRMAGLQCERLPPDMSLPTG
ncbi:MAG: hypothetical protein Q9194_004500 [Teloschistes cf. exilis]